MKKFLEDLEKELTKMKINKGDIDEILSDHKEMIESGKAEGLNEEDMNKKFGNPENIAKVIYKDTQETALNSAFKNDAEDCTIDISEEGFQQIESFMADEINDFVIKLVCDDVVVIPHKEDTIVVYQKGIKSLDKYTIEFKANRFELSKDKTRKLFSLERNGGTFLIKLPETALISNYNLKSVSGDYVINSLKAKELKIKTVSGDFKLSNVFVDEFDITTVSGDAEINKLEAKILDINTVSGDIGLNKASINGLVDINTVSGDIEANYGECAKLNLKSASGDFEATDFYPAKVNLKSISGDISITNADKTRVIEIERKKTLTGTIDIY